MMGEVFGEILKNILKYIFVLLPFFDNLDIANAISQKILVLEARNFYQLIEYNEKITCIW